MIIYDQECAAEKRRKRSRGMLAEPTLRLVINEEVCEGCGDCVKQSNCMSLQPVVTELGQKMRIHQSSCNKDYTCALGDCPSFVSVQIKPGTGLKKKPLPQLPPADVSRAARSGAGRRRIPHHRAGHRRHRRGDDQRAAGHRGLDRRPVCRDARSDRHGAEGRRGGVASAAERAADRSARQGERGECRPDPGLRSDGRREPGKSQDRFAGSTPSP